MDQPVRLLMSLVGLTLWLGAFGVLIPYFVRPEKFFIRRLRRNYADPVTHLQIILRAYVGVGLIVVWCGLIGSQTIIGIPNGDPALGLLRFLASEPSMAALVVAVMLVIGTGSYIGLRFRRYRKAAPGEFPVTAERTGGLFVLRGPVDH